jgi:hypothetical protein
LPLFPAQKLYLTVMRRRFFTASIVSLRLNIHHLPAIISLSSCTFKKS